MTNDTDKTLNLLETNERACKIARSVKDLNYQQQVAVVNMALHIIRNSK